MSEIKYNRYVIKNGEKLIIPFGDPPEDSIKKEEEREQNLRKYQNLKEKLSKKYAF